MLPTFIIALREGVEAALIVGIVAAFLVREGRRDALPKVWLGVLGATAICVAVGLALRAAGEGLPHRQQEGLETVIGLLAVSMVTYMIVWMKRHSRGLKATLQGSAAGALKAGSAAALVSMAFLAVFREGFETAVFMVAVFQDTPNPGSAGTGAVLGLLAAMAIGWGFYKGGIRFDLARFFRVTGVVLTLVAAGLLSFALHTAHEAGWFNVLQAQALDLTWLVKPGTVSGGLLTGILGLQPEPTTAETAVYLLYAVPMVAFVLWPDRWLRARRSRSAVRPAITATLLCLVALVAAACGSSDGSASAAGTVKVTISDSGCDPADIELGAGERTFEVTGGATGGVSEFEILDGSDILGEVENLAPGLARTFTVTLEPGSYELLCEAGSEESMGELTVTAAE